MGVRVVMVRSLAHRATADSPLSGDCRRSWKKQRDRGWHDDEQRAPVSEQSTARSFVLSAEAGFATG
jgi:hypothetical protein